MNNIEYQFEFLSQALRMQLEMINKYPGLVKVDDKEATFNIEIAVKSVLDAFHNVYDAIQQISGKTIDFHQYIELFIILNLRNDKHHNRKLQSIFFEKDDILYVDYATKDAFPCITYPISWNDISINLNSNRKNVFKIEDIRRYLQAKEFEIEAEKNNYSKIYINIIPLMLQAGKRLVELCEEFIPNNLDSIEAKFFLNHFKEIPSNLELVTKSPYNQEAYIKDIEHTIFIAEKIHQLMFNGRKNLYLDEIQYK